MTEYCYVVMICNSQWGGTTPVAVYECEEEAISRAAKAYEYGCYFATVAKLPYFKEAQIHEV